jgi:hypothetical protein
MQQAYLPCVLGMQGADGGRSRPGCKTARWWHTEAQGRRHEQGGQGSEAASCMRYVAAVDHAYLVLRVRAVHQWERVHQSTGRAVASAWQP